MVSPLIIRMPGQGPEITTSGWCVNLDILNVGTA
jgi:hypothetical protein